MKQVLCARCKKRPAMFFVTKVEGDKTTQEGLCIKCALEMNIGPVKQIMQSMGISEDELDDVSEQFEAMFGEDGGFEPGGAGTMPFLQNFAAMNGDNSAPQTSEEEAAPEKKKRWGKKNKDKGELFVSMPRYRSNERDESNGVIYKDVCNPITAEFREKLYTNILDAYARIKEPEKEETQKQDRTQEMPEFSVTVTPYEREGSNIKGLARIYFENSFIVNNINIVQGKKKIFVSMPSYKTKQVDEQGKPIYQDVCYPVTKDFREKLYNEIILEYEKAKDKSNEKARESAEKHHGNPDKEKDKEATPFR